VISSQTIKSDQTYQEFVSNVLRKRWGYLGQVLRSNEKRLNRQILMWTPGGKRKRGRPKTTLRNTILKEGTTMDCNTIQDLHLLALHGEPKPLPYGSKGTN